VHLAQLLGQPEETLTQGRMSYHLRRLRLHGLIQRIAKPIVTVSLTLVFALQCFARASTPGFFAIESAWCCRPPLPFPAPYSAVSTNWNNTSTPGWITLKWPPDT
jgi:hypothetical protein